MRFCAVGLRDDSSMMRLWIQPRSQ